MNRKKHVQETLPKNIKDNLKYDNVEFILLDYNSKDGLEDWVKSNLIEYINIGKLKYYRIITPIFFDRSHSRNIMFRLAEGELICNIDADNFTGVNFSEYIYKKYLEDENMLLVADTKGIFYNLRDAFGRFCIKRKSFLEVHGYDEQMTSYGSEDIDLYERLLRNGHTEKLIENVNYLKSILHGDQERTENEFIVNNLLLFYISFISAWESKVLFLYRDNTYEYGTIIPNKYDTWLPICIKEGKWRKGTWKNLKDSLLLKSENGIDEKFDSSDNGLTFSNGNLLFYKNEVKEFLQVVLITHPMITNQEIYEQNKINRKTKVNPYGFGKGVVYKNFDYDTPIILN